MSANPIAFNDLFKGFPLASSLEGKSVVLADEQGEGERLELERLKCQMLFGLSEVVIKRRLNASGKSREGIINENNKVSQWYSEFGSGIQAGACAVFVVKLDSGEIATVYSYTLDQLYTTADNKQYRLLRPLMVEVPGYTPFINPNAKLA